MLDSRCSIHPPTQSRPQMTQITQIHAEENICVVLRDLRGISLNVPQGRSLTSRSTPHFAASSIEYRESDGRVVGKYLRTRIHSLS